METTTTARNEAETRRLLAEISIAYLEVLSGLRRPEQLARWVSDRFYTELIHRSRRESMSRQITGLNARPKMQLVASNTFPTANGTAQTVSLIRIAGRIFAVSLMAAQLHGRLRVTEIDLVKPF